MGGVPIALAGVTGFIASRSRRLALAYDATYLKGTPVGEEMFFGGVLHAEMKTDTGVPSCLPSVRPHSRGRFSRTILADDSRGRFSRTILVVVALLSCIPTATTCRDCVVSVASTSKAWMDVSVLHSESGCLLRAVPHGGHGAGGVGGTRIFHLDQRLQLVRGVGVLVAHHRRVSPGTRQAAVWCGSGWRHRGRDVGCDDHHCTRGGVRSAQSQGVPMRRTRSLVAA